MPKDKDKTVSIVGVDGVQAHVTEVREARAVWNHDVRHRGDTYEAGDIVPYTSDELNHTRIYQNPQVLGLEVKGADKHSKNAKDIYRAPIAEAVETAKARRKVREDEEQRRRNEAAAHSQSVADAAKRRAG